MSNNDGVRPGRVVTDWWRTLHPREDGTGGDRATTARLRRAETLHQVVNDRLNRLECSPPTRG